MVVEVIQETRLDNGDQAPDVEAAKPTVGIIYPPPEVRNIVDKTAGFVAKNGPDFETRIRQNEINNSKFNFLNDNDPYHSYYKHKVKEIMEGKAQEPSGASKSSLGYQPQKPPTLPEESPQLQQQRALLEAMVIKDPPPEFEFTAEAPSIAAYDLDILKLTAQFVARNGRQFLSNLINREQRNYQFDFLRPQHNLFNYFKSLVDQYTKVYLPPKDLMEKLAKDVEEPKNILDQVMYRVSWTQHQEREKKREEHEKEKERVAYAQIDWHDFVVVEVVDFQTGEAGIFPPPTTPEEVGARILAQERYAADDQNEKEEEKAPKKNLDDVTFNPINEEAKSGKKDEVNGNKDVEEEKEKAVAVAKADTNVQDMEEDSDDEDLMPPPHLPPPPPAYTQLPPIPQLAPPAPKPPVIKMDQVLIRRGYDPKATADDTDKSSSKYLISPITGEKILADKIQEHIRIGLLDPKWKEQTEKMVHERREQDELYAPGMSIGSHLRKLAERRTDIFGSAEEETQIGKKLGEEDKKETKVIWDGHSTSMEKVTQKARENITIEDQIAVIHKNKGLVQDEDKEKIGPAMPRNPPSHPPMTIHQTHQAHNPIPSFRPPSMPPSFSQNPPRPPMMVPNPQMMQPPRPSMDLMASLGGMVLMNQAAAAAHNQGMGGMPHPPFMIPNNMRPPNPNMRPPNMAPLSMPPQPQFPHRRPFERPSDNDESQNKKSKIEGQFMPEHQFLSAHPGPVEFKVQVPGLEKSEWKLNGQVFIVRLPLTDPVSVIKAKIHEEVGMPAGKQKLQCETVFLKDSNTLAYYNFTGNTVVHLQVKERGGRKK